VGRARHVGWHDLIVHVDQEQLESSGSSEWAVARRHSATLVVLNFEKRHVFFFFFFVFEVERVQHDVSCLCA
jgi:hypothetical protein